ncbi:MAG: hypothetical protein ABI637_04560 [Gemmatimonadota bacterium]
MITHNLRWVIGVISAVVLVACANGGDPTIEGPIVDPLPPPAGSSVTLAVLFIGNSLTYVNDLPATLTGVAAGNGDRIRTEMVAGPRVGLGRHLVAGSEARAAIQRGGWDYVVLQTGSTSDSAFNADLVNDVRQFDVLARAGGARTALYVTWASAGGDFCFAGSLAAAAAVNAVLLPTSVAWERTLRQYPSALLYGPDGAHPSPAGTYLVAITIYETLTGHDARTLSDRAVVNGVALNEPLSAVRQLQEAAHSASSDGVEAGDCGQGADVRQSAARSREGGRQVDGSARR